MNKVCCIENGLNNYKILSGTLNPLYQLRIIRLLKQTTSELE